ncbi:MAG: hypothetical protein KDA60_12055, partial [Planctomycetales bacterium]|nr:hypothetical protein [Planctomycetales bacterium]
GRLVPPRPGRTFVPRGKVSMLPAPGPPDIARMSWLDGAVHQTGFTTLIGELSTVIAGPPPGNPLVWTNQVEGTSQTIRTYAIAPTSSSHSGGVVVTSRMDGSVHVMSATAAVGPTWDALSTRAGNEISEGL